MWTGTKKTLRWVFVALRWTLKGLLLVARTTVFTVRVLSGGVRGLIKLSQRAIAASRTNAPSSAFADAEKGRSLAIESPEDVPDGAGEDVVAAGGGSP